MKSSFPTWFIELPNIRPAGSGRRNPCRSLVFWVLIFPGLAGPVAPLPAQEIAFDSSTFRGTEGYFRVARTREGQWWFVTPDGKPFFYKGICAVNRAGTAGGRRANPGPYAAVVDRKYNYPHSPDAFVEATFRTMRSLGFNALGAWATEEFFNKGMPFTEIIEFFKEEPFLPSPNQHRRLPDIFDPQWLVAADRKARALCSPMRYSKDLVGYFTDNEIGFGRVTDQGFDPGFEAGQFDFALLRVVLGMDSARAAHKAAWQFLLERHGHSFGKLSAAWGVPIAGPLDVKGLNDKQVQIPGKAYETDAEAFSILYARRYFALAEQFIRRYDPNHLILGCRFGAPPPLYVLDAIKPHTDVLSANNYRPTLYERYDTVIRYTGLPLLIGEISWNTELFRKIPFAEEAAGPLSVKDRMFRAGSHTLRRAAMHDGIVGFTWYRWVQGVSTEEKFSDGVVNYLDEPNVHVPQQRQVVPGLEQVRRAAGGGKWKTAPIATGEMTLFFDSLRTDWPHYLRLEWQQGKLLPHLAGYKMSGKPVQYKLTGNRLDLRLDVAFAETPTRTGTIPAGKGTYTLRLRRDGEKWHGAYTGRYNGTPISGGVYGFYFPESIP